WRGLCLLALAVLGAPQATMPAFAQNSPAAASDVVHLVPGTSINVTANPYGSKTLWTYCYKGKRPSIINFLETIEFHLAIRSEDFAQYGGKTPAEVLEHYNQRQSLFSVTLFSQKRQRIPISPFEQQCIGIESRQPYNMSLQHMPLDVWHLMQLSAGLLLFWISRRLAKNSVFYYLAGVILGICASMLVIIYLAARVIPRRPMMYGVLIGGWTLGFYVLKQVVDNMRLILLTYREYVVWYLIVTGLISFLICYRIGPPKNPRSQNIVMWVLQATGGALVYFSSWHTNAAAFLIAVTFVIYPPSLVEYFKRSYRRRFPPKRRLLTQEEYYQQTAKETANSLSELQKYLNSPGCKQWDLVTKLHNPMRFAEFANGAPHLNEEEIDDYSRAIEESLEAAQED
ncbi:hypothetical protein KR038_007996, partial [Drosophila bunnanda]